MATPHNGPGPARYIVVNAHLTSSLLPPPSTIPPQSSQQHEEAKQAYHFLINLLTDGLARQAEIMPLEACAVQTGRPGRQWVCKVSAHDVALLKTMYRHCEERYLGLMMPFSAMPITALEFSGAREHMGLRAYAMAS